MAYTEPTTAATDTSPATTEAAEVTTEAVDAASAPRAQSWRDTIKTHPAAELFPLMSKTELAELGNDIKTNGLISPIVLWLASKDAQAQLLDGRSRLDALEVELGRPVRITSHTFRGRTTWSLEADDDGHPVPVTDLLGDEGFPFGTRTRAESIFVVLGPDTDPHAYVTAANLHRRHLTAEQKRDLIAKLIKADPSKSDRQIGERINADHKTVGTVRKEQEATGEVSPVEKRVGADGKAHRQPASRPRPRARTPAPQDAAKADAAKGDAAVTPDGTVTPDAEPAVTETRNGIGPTSAGETAHELARLEEPEAELVRLRRLNIALESEVEESDIRPPRCAASRNSRRDVEKHYATLSFEELAALPLRNLAHRDGCHLFEWTSAPHLPRACELIACWSFKYSSVAFTWVKLLRSLDPESVPPADRSRFPQGARTDDAQTDRACPARPARQLPAQCQNVCEVILAPMREHSRKPDQFYEIPIWIYSRASAGQIGRSGAIRSTRLMRWRHECAHHVRRQRNSGGQGPAAHDSQGLCLHAGGDSERGTAPPKLFS
jgi:hypothetical protein